LLVVREGEQAYVERQGSVRVLRVPTHEADPAAQIQSFQRALKRQLDGADYDVVHCRDSWSGIPVLEARSRLGYAGRLRPDAIAARRDHDGCRARRAVRPRRRGVHLASDLVLAPTRGVGQSAAGSRQAERVLLSPPGVDVDRFDWDEAPKSGRRAFSTPARSIRGAACAC
jgi:hypothetical protein